eukprot:jgi/Botrbrau1/10935/Bobra.0025s0108.1
MVPFVLATYVRKNRVWFIPTAVVASKYHFGQKPEIPALTAGPIPSLASFFLGNTESRLPIGAPCRPQVPHESTQNSPLLVSWALERRNKALLFSKTAERMPP